MDLTEITAVPEAVLPVAAFRGHLRLGTGFADDASNDAALAQYLRAAIAVVEGRTGKALLARGFRLVLPCWRWPDAQVLPIAPVAAVDAITVRDATGTASEIAAARWRLERDRHRPRIVATGALLPAVPAGGQVEVAFTAGFGPDWSDVPDDLAQAVFLLAAQYHEGRTGAGDEVPVSVAALTAGWQPMRLSAGRQA
ncbi:MAG: Phage QLRG family, putative DNA packaging [Rhodobacteraceae bacterium HLUCCA12]|nr:MAG: Phage QLRG family, putative DNA packaging [Rhodobacteraceae bacterium HLUCCA12]